MMGLTRSLVFALTYSAMYSRRRAGRSRMDGPWGRSRRGSGGGVNMVDVREGGDDEEDGGGPGGRKLEAVVEEVEVGLGAGNGGLWAKVRKRAMEQSSRLITLGGYLAPPPRRRWRRRRRRGRLGGGSRG
ncbi:hypothetical protein COCNU_04G002780 [Cocos nucifera]|uniref:Uncharacterized protein n=1 Tax=Cocos nucifera TaxID=13894 RepID=A0A8K0MZU9_COCNU|nr:hypothetical protein COCNU_04G002780 [Cocos nucifera]